MLRNTKLCTNISSYLLIKNNYNRPLDSRILRYQCRLLSDKNGGKKIDPCSKEKKPEKKGVTCTGEDLSKPRRPPMETAQQPPGTCKDASSVKPGSPSLMDQLPKPTVNCKWEEEQKKFKFKKTIPLIAGIIILALTIVPAYNWITGPAVPKQKKDGHGVTAPKRKSRRPWKIKKVPPSSVEIPDEIPYLLIGAGTASFAAFRAIKSKDPKAKVLVIGDEPYYPYMRPPLSKELFFVEDRNVAKSLKFKQWNGVERSMFYELDDFYSSVKTIKDAENGGVAVARGWKVKRIDATNRIAYLEDDKKIKYQKCLIATGAKPKGHPVFDEITDKDIKDKVSLYRNIFDFEELEDIIEWGAKSIVVVGGSFLGSELACALAKRGKNQRLKVTQIFKESGHMGKLLPEYLSLWTTKKVKQEGVDVISNTIVEDVELKNNQLLLILNNGKTIAADQVVLAIGVEPNTDLAKTSDLEVHGQLGGFLVNAELEARSNLYAAGDCACFYDAKLGRRRVEHHDHAVVSGRLAGENMTGAGKPYWHQSMFWSDLGPDVGYEAIGVVDSSLPTVGVYAKVSKKDKPESIKNKGDADDGMRSTSEELASLTSTQVGDDAEGDEEEDREEELTPSEKKEAEKFSEDYGKGVIFYLRDSIVVGIVLWNVFNRMSIARQVLRDERKYDDLNEVAKLFNIHKD